MLEFFIIVPLLRLIEAKQLQQILQKFLGRFALAVHDRQPQHLTSVVGSTPME